MSVIWCRYNYNIGKLRLSKHLVIMSETVFRRNIVFVCHILASAFKDIRHTYNLHVLRESFRISRVESSAVSCTDNDSCYLLVSLRLQRTDVHMDLSVRSEHFSLRPRCWVNEHVGCHCERICKRNTCCNKSAFFKEFSSDHNYVILVGLLLFSFCCRVEEKLVHLLLVDV